MGDSKKVGVVGRTTPFWVRKRSEAVRPTTPTVPGERNIGLVRDSAPFPLALFAARRTHTVFKRENPVVSMVVLMIYPAIVVSLLLMVGAHCRGLEGFFISMISCVQTINVFIVCFV